MKYVCPECKCQYEGDLDFCPRCGCMRDKAAALNDQGQIENVCPGCGERFNLGDRYCGKCGHELPAVASDPMAMAPHPRKYGTVAIVAALLGGFFNVFGLGHIILKKYSRAAMFLVISLVLWYLNGWTWASTSILTLVLDFVIYFYQCMDILRVAYSPEDS